MEVFYAQRILTKTCQSVTKGLDSMQILNRSVVDAAIAGEGDFVLSNVESLRWNS